MHRGVATDQPAFIKTGPHVLTCTLRCFCSLAPGAACVDRVSEEGAERCIAALPPVEASSGTPCVIPADRDPGVREKSSSQLQSPGSATAARSAVFLQAISYHSREGTAAIQ